MSIATESWSSSDLAVAEPQTNLEFSFSDSIAGYVRRFDRLTRSFTLETSDGREFEVMLTPTTFGRITQNLGEGYIDATGRFGELLTDGQLVYVYGVFYFDGAPQHKFEAKSIVFPGNTPEEFRHEEADWWIKQIHSIANSYLKWQFNHPNEAIDYRNYRTRLQLEGGKKGDFLQETDTISRLVYGFASAFLLTGDDSFLEAAEKGTQYLRDHMRFYDQDENLVYWYHGIQVTGNREQKLLTSEFGDDFDSIPMYEQIYALAGPMQTYRATGDPKILTDIEKTIVLFDRFYIDSDLGGYFSHIDPVTLDPRADSLGANRARKNWNSVGDHAPAYLINLYLATGDPRYADFLDDTFDTIAKHFPDYANSPFVQEVPRRLVARQLLGLAAEPRGRRPQPQDRLEPDAHSARSPVGEVRRARPQDRRAHAERRQRPAARRLVRRGRTHAATRPKRPPLRLARSQGLVAAGAGHPRLPDPARLARRCRLREAWPARRRRSTTPSSSTTTTAASTSTSLANGLPYLLGNERLKGSHSMSGYHSIELCYLASVYTNLLITKQPMDVLLQAAIRTASRTASLRVSPDILPPGSVQIEASEIDGEPYTDFDADALTVRCPSRTIASK